MNKGLVIVIEANIAVGKTSLCNSLYNYLKKTHNVRLYIESIPNEKLDLYLTDPKKYAWSTQSYMFPTRLNILKEAYEFSQTGGISIIDRGIIGDLVFTNLDHNKGYINDVEYEVYKKLRTNILKYKIDLVLYLQCNIETNLYRLNKRGNTNEIKTYDYTYLLTLQKEYDKCINEYYDKKLIVDWSINYNITNGLLPDNIIIKLINDMNNIMLN